jgi:hypothetical protein
MDMPSEGPRAAREDDSETERYRRAAEDALQQLDWCIAYLRKINKTRIARVLSRNRDIINNRIQGGDTHRPAGSATGRAKTAEGRDETPKGGAKTAKRRDETPKGRAETAKRRDETPKGPPGTAKARGETSGGPRRSAKDRREPAKGGGGTAQGPAKPARGRDETSGGEDLLLSSKRELYERARDLGVEGRSAMSKEELAHAIAEAGGRPRV